MYGLGVNQHVYVGVVMFVSLFMIEIYLSLLAFIFHRNQLFTLDCIRMLQIAHFLYYIIIALRLLVKVLRLMIIIIYILFHIDLFGIFIIIILVKKKIIMVLLSWRGILYAVDGL